MPYRTNAKPPVTAFKCSRPIFAVFWEATLATIVVLSIYLGVLCGFAWLTKAVVSGLVGHEVGSFKSYLGGWFLYRIIKCDLRSVIRYIDRGW